MRKLLISFLVGCIIGAGVCLALFLSHQKPSEDSHALETLDYAIDQWTAQRFDAEAIAAIGFPGAKVGYIPDTVYALARRVDSLYHVPEGVVIAQWILESRFGLSDLKANNFFGHTFLAVRAYMSDPKYVLRREKVVVSDAISTGKPVRFALYKDIAESFDTHGKYLSQSGRYRLAFSTISPEEFAKRLSKGGYASDPDYALKLIVIMRRYKL
jgi:flagellar protein FlgJ